MRVFRASSLVAALAVPALLLAGLTGTAAGAASPAGPAGLSAVSCPTTSWCMAVGSYVDRSHVRHAMALEWNGRAWRELRNPPGGVLRSVSCSSPSFCMARSGLAGRTEVWNGRTWRAVASPQHAATAPSCGSRSECMLINSVGAAHSGSVVESWNGRAWRTWAQQTSSCPLSEGPCFTNDVSCGSATSCVAAGATTNTGGSQQVIGGFRWERTRWVTFRGWLPFDGNPANAYQVSCVGLFCMTTGSAFQEVANGDVAAADAWNGRSHSSTSASPKLGVLTCKSSFQPCAWTKAISCGSSASCMTITIGHGNLAWNGAAWTAAPFAPAGSAAALGGLSCRAKSCMAVGHKTASGRQSTLAELWNGKTWKVVPTPR